MTCKKCGENSPIVNKRHWLCNECNYKRLNNGVSRAEMYAKRAKDRQEYKTPRKINAKHKPKPIRQQTSKEVSIKRELIELKKQVHQEAQDNEMYYCWGCGMGGVGLDSSHILSVGQRKDLELDKDNINLFCRECHMDWESNDPRKMIPLITFENDLLYIKKHDKKRYNDLIAMIDEYSIEIFDEVVRSDLNDEFKEKMKRLSQHDYI